MGEGLRVLVAEADGQDVDEEADVLGLVVMAVVDGDADDEVVLVGES